METAHRMDSDGERALMADSEFLARRDALLASKGVDATHSVGTFIEHWEAFVTECEDGYAFCWAEWLNDVIGVRRPIDLLFGDPIVGADWRMTQFATRLADADNRLRALFVDGVLAGGEGQPWWQRGLLRFAGREYAEDARAMFDVPIEVAE
jgi:hypothetical protein